jgi:hypothetical protein
MGRAKYYIEKPRAISRKAKISVPTDFTFAKDYLSKVNSTIPELSFPTATGKYCLLVEDKQDTIRHRSDRSNS